MRQRICLLLAAVFASVAPTANAVDNVIFFIGDGMGFNHVKAGRAYVNGSTAIPLAFEQLLAKAESVTTLPDNSVTDSATAGTALATGYQHPVNGVISMGASNSIKTTLLELAKAKGMATAIITTDDIGGATPGAFGAHEPDRTLMSAIRADYLRDDAAQGHLASQPYVLLGGGFNDPNNLPGVNASFVSLAKSLGYNFVTTTTELNAGSGKLIGLFGTSWAPMDTMADPTRDLTQPTLSQMLTKALQLMEGNGGFFIMVESANIDKLSHVGVKTFVAEVAELNKAVQVAIDWKDSHTLYDNTSIFVTADHETGGLTLPDQTVTPGTIPAMTFTTTGHTGANVPLYATWPARVSNLILDNTDTFFLVQDALNFSKNGQPPVVTGLTASDVTDTSASVQWTTVEPANGIVQLTGGGKTLSFSAAGANAHVALCTGLQPGTTYSVTAISTDLAGFSGTGSASLTTVGTSQNAVVLSEPVVSFGTVSGTYLGVQTANDGVTQTISEAADAIGASLTVDYTLHTSTPVSEIDALTLNAVAKWSGSDGAKDGLLAYARVLTPDRNYVWEPITFPFVAEPVSSYADASGNILVRFEDGASFRRERKDTLTIDSLVGTIVKSGATVATLTAPTLVATQTGTQPSVILNWSSAGSAIEFQVWRHLTSEGWKVIGEYGSDVTSCVDMTIASLTTYHYVVRVYNREAYADSQQVAVSVPVVLFAPANLKASIVKGSASLTWTDTNTAETGYQVQRGTTPDGNFAVLANLAANTAKYTDRSVARGTTYYYKVRAVYGTQYGGDSGTFSILVP